MQRVAMRATLIFQGSGDLKDPEIDNFIASGALDVLVEQAMSSHHQHSPPPPPAQHHQQEDFASSDSELDTIVAGLEEDAFNRMDASRASKMGKHAST